MSNQEFTVQTIQGKIINLPGREPFMLGQDLAAIYETEPKYIARAVKRNSERFPDDFVFQLTDEEVGILRCQIGTANPDLKLQDAPSNFAKIRSNPLGFSQAGANMLSVVLNSRVAVERSKEIVRAFTSMPYKAIFIFAKDRVRLLMQMIGKPVPYMLGEPANVQSLPVKAAS